MMNDRELWYWRPIIAHPSKQVKGAFEFGHDPYNSVDAHVVRWNVQADARVARMLNSERLEKSLRALRV